MHNELDEEFSAEDGKQQLLNFRQRVVLVEPSSDKGQLDLSVLD